MTPDSNDRDRLEQLMADRALVGLTDAEAQELRQLRRRLGEPEDDGLDAAAAILAAVFVDEGAAEEMPAALRERIARDAVTFFAPGEQRDPTTVVDLPVKPRRRLGSQLGWMAAAACLALAVVAWWIPRGDGGGTAPSELRRQLVAAADELTRLDWTATEDPAAGGASGDVVWSDARQEGYMRFRGLRANDPGEYQYQLWIFDAARRLWEERPVDGGLFDCPETGEVVIPIEARLPINDARLFAVTAEEPGGVIVSRS